MLLTSGRKAVATTAQGVAAFQRGKYEDALKFLVPEAEKGDADAMFPLGQMHATGRGVEKDLTKSAEHFRNAAEPRQSGGAAELRIGADAR